MMVWIGDGELSANQVEVWDMMRKEMKEKEIAGTVTPEVKRAKYERAQAREIDVDELAERYKQKIVSFSHESDFDRKHGYFTSEGKPRRNAYRLRPLGFKTDDDEPNSALT